jgi:hypothetical protein
VPEHDRLPLILDDEARHPVFSVSVHTFSGIAEDFTSASSQAGLRYLRCTLELSLWYSASSSLSLLVFSDADFAGCPIDRKSTSRICQFLGSSLVSWSSRKQSSVAHSTTEAEYVATTSCCSQLLWITYTLSDFGEECSHVPVMCDSMSAISVFKNPVLHSRTKHIEVRYHFLRDNVEKGNIDLIHVPTKKQLADILTKPLDQATFAHL